MKTAEQRLEILERAILQIQKICNDNNLTIEGDELSVSVFHHELKSELIRKELNTVPF